MAVSGERDLVVHLLHFCRLWGGWLAVHWSGAHDLDLPFLKPAQTSSAILIVQSEIKLGKSSSSSTHHPLLTLPRLHNHKWLWQAPRFLLLLNLPLYFLPGPRPWVCPLLCDSYRRVPGMRQKYSLAPFPKDKKPRAESRSLLHKS